MRTPPIFTLDAYNLCCLLYSCTSRNKEGHEEVVGRTFLAVEIKYKKQRTVTQQSVDEQITLL